LEEDRSHNLIIRREYTLPPTLSDFSGMTQTPRPYWPSQCAAYCGSDAGDDGIASESGEISGGVCDEDGDGYAAT